MVHPELHPALKPIAWLLGTWTGEGRGSYPTISPFTYAEETRFWHMGRPLLAYSQRTWNPETGTAMHSEMGFWRVTQIGIELVLAHTFGIVEIQEGQIERDRIVTRSRDLVSSGTAKTVQELNRTYELMGGRLNYYIQMAAAEQKLQGHLEASLQKG
ncbi:MAG TPA: FABP family protein [Actinomycetota bacterium]|nr:FABP family protein [Actinomycetota bacterium]